MTVFLMVIGESMPPTSEKLPLIGLYYGVTISLVTFATGLSVVTLSLHHRGMRGTRLSPWLRYLVLHLLAKLLHIRLEGNGQDENEEERRKMEMKSKKKKKARVEENEVRVEDTVGVASEGWKRGW